MQYRIEEVLTKIQQKKFLRFPLSIYKEDLQWVRPLDKDIEIVFDKKKNKFFKSGICSRWLLYDDKKNELIGRIAAFVNKRYKQEKPTGGIGFFECINEQAAANFMFDHCRQWLKNQGMEAMDGPINFGERDKWWGLLIEGFYEPLYCMNYNPPYYKDLFENYGFQVYFYQECFGMDVKYEFQQKYFKRHQEVAAIDGIKAIPVKKNALIKFAKDFAYIYNLAWASHGGGKTMEEKQAIKIFKSMKPVLDERISWFVYHQEEPIAFWINIPDLNQYFKKMNGQFSWWHKIKFLYLKYLGNCNRFVGIVFGIIPKWQGKGIDNYMIIEGAKVIVSQTNYKNYEMQWIGDFNPKMLNIAHSLGATVTRRLATYRYNFNPKCEFKRHPIL